MRYLDNLDVTLQADLSKLIGLPHTTAYVYGLGNQDGSRALVNLSIGLEVIF